ncbi:MAG: serine/threonine protein kinase [Myxococcales bacterium]|nr:serine/threonine protein kinase [Myxococcales bacterium]
MSTSATGPLVRQYRLLGRIGQGAMGTVWEAERVKDGHRVALKLLKRELLDEGKALHRFRREARLSARLDHPSVVSTLDAGVDEESGQPWIAMELIRGPALSAWLAEHGKPALDAGFRLLEQIFSAVARAHELGIVHRDLKPENVLLLLDEAGAPTAKVSDFGIAKGLADKSLASTEAGLGTPLWTAPEQARPGFVPSPSADVWALGLLTYFVLTSHHYWRHAGAGSSVVDLMLELERGELEPASLRAAGVGAGDALPPGFDAWFARSVNRRPEQRFASAGEAWVSLAKIRKGEAGEASESRRLVYVVLLGVVLIGVAAAVYLGRG